MATKAGVKVIILTHFVPANDKLTDMTPYTAGVQEYFGGAVIPGKDLFEYDLSKTSVAKTPK
jgi:ribonuclease BN (tRNA processing enzyme)